MSIEIPMDSGVDNQPKPHQLAAREMLDAMLKDGRRGGYGLRVIPPDDKIGSSSSIGDTLGPSNIWRDGNPTEKQLVGTSAVRIKSRGESSISSAIRQAGADGDNRNSMMNGYYFGHKIALLHSENITSGTDKGEGVMRSPRIIGFWQKPTNGPTEVHPNIPAPIAAQQANQDTQSQGNGAAPSQQ